MFEYTDFAKGLLYLVAHAPPMAKGFEWKPAEAEPLQPQAHDFLNATERQEYWNWTQTIRGHNYELDGLSLNVRSFAAVAHAAHKVWREWKAQFRGCDEIAWRWHWAQKVMEMAPGDMQVIPVRPIHAIPFPGVDHYPEVLRSAGCTSILAIADERARQITKKGYSAERDDKYTNGELASAGAWYAIPFTSPESVVDASGDLWPSDWDIPHLPFDKSIPGRKRELEKAAALIAAEWDRLDRLERKGETT